MTDEKTKTEKRLIYISTCDSNLGNEDVSEIVNAAVERNSREKITGILLFNGLNFLQVLEGEAQAVDALYKDIISDQRHHGVTTVLEEEIVARAFPVWSMNFAITASSAQPLPDWAKPGARADFNAEDISPLHVQLIVKSFDTLKG